MPIRRRPWRSFAPPIALVSLALLAACLPGATRPPIVPLRGRLAPDMPRTSALRGTSGPLRVAFATPQGETDQVTEVSFVFSKPMRALGLGPHDPPLPLVMTPEAEGSWQWVGSTALRFNARVPLASATSYRGEFTSLDVRRSTRARGSSAR